MNTQTATPCPHCAEMRTEWEKLFAALLALVEEKQPLGIERPAYQTALHLIVDIEDREDACHTNC